MVGENNPNFGKHLSDDTKGKVRAKALERDVSGENNPMYGKHHTEKAKEKISKAKTGKPSPLKGVPLSEATKAKLREKALARAAAKKAAKEAAELAAKENSDK